MLTLSQVHILYVVSSISILKTQLYCFYKIRHTLLYNTFKGLHPKEAQQKVGGMGMAALPSSNK